MNCVVACINEHVHGTLSAVSLGRDWRRCTSGYLISPWEKEQPFRWTISRVFVCVALEKVEPKKGEIKSTFQPLKKCTVNVGDIWVIQTVTPREAVFSDTFKVPWRDVWFPCPSDGENEYHCNRGCVLGDRGVGGPSATKLGNRALHMAYLASV